MSPQNIGPNAQPSSQNSPLAAQTKRPAQSAAERMGNFVRENFVISLISLLATVFFGAIGIGYMLNTQMIAIKQTQLDTQKNANEQLTQQNTDLNADLQDYIVKNNILQNTNEGLKYRNDMLKGDSVTSHGTIATLRQDNKDIQTRGIRATQLAVAQEHVRGNGRLAALRRETDYRISLIEQEKNRQLAAARDSLHYSESQRQLAMTRAVEAETLLAQYKSSAERNEVGQQALAKGQELQRQALQRKGKGIWPFGGFILSKDVRRDKLNMALAAFQRAEDCGMLSPGYCRKLAIDFETFM